MFLNTSKIGRIAVRNTVWLSLFSYVGQFVSFATTILLTRMLGPEVFGVFALGTFWASLLALRSKFGINFAALRQPTVSGALLGSYFRLDILVSTASLVLSIGAAALLPYWGYPTEITVVVVVLAVCEFFPVLVGPYGLALEKELQLSRMSLVGLAGSILASGTALLMAYSGVGVWSLLVMSLITTLVGIGGIYWVAMRRVAGLVHQKWTYNRTIAQQLLYQGVPIGLANQGQSVVVSQFDNFLIGTYSSTTTLGYYDRAYRTSQWPNTLLTAALTRVGYLVFTRIQDDLPRLTYAVKLSFWVLTTLGTPLALAIFFSAPDLVTILYTDAWLPSAFFLRFLVLYSLISPFISLGSSLAYALGSVQTPLLIALSQAAALILFGLPLTLWLGATGTVLAVGITTAVGFTLSAAYVFRKLPISIIDVFGIPLVGLSASSMLTMLLFQAPGWVDLSPLVRWITISITASGSYLLCITALRPAEMNERIRYLVATFRNTRRSVDEAGV